MISLQQCVLIFAGLAALVSYSSAEAIHCYACESTVNANCGEKFNPEGISKLDCSTPPVGNFLQKLLPLKNATGCMKAVNEVLGKKQILRACYFGDIKLKADCQTDLDINGFKQLSCDVCTDNYCNGSSVLAIAPIALAIALFALVANRLY